MCESVHVTGVQHPKLFKVWIAQKYLKIDE